MTYAINYLASPEAFRLGERIMVIGSGNSAMDCARTAIRHGARYVTVINRTGEIAASQYESSYAKLEGVRFLMYRMPLEIREDGIVLADVEVAEDGSIAAVPGSEKLYPCTGIIIAVSQGAEKNLASRAGLDMGKGGLLTVDESGHTSREGVFAAGDATSGARTVVEAVAKGKEVAEAMHAYMQSLPLPEPSVYANAPVVEEIESAAQAEQLLNGE